MLLLSLNFFTDEILISPFIPLSLIHGELILRQSKPMSNDMLYADICPCITKQWKETATLITFKLNLINFSEILVFETLPIKNLKIN